MSFFSSPAFGQIAGSVIGGIMGNKAAKYQAGADRYAVDQQMRPFNLKEPFLRDLYGGAQGALNDALATGAFTGPTYAGLDPMQMRGITGMGAFGDRALGLGSSFMDTGQGFAQNAADLYGRAGGRTLDDAVSYAASSPQAQSLIEAAMRDSTRRLEEQTLPGIDRAAAGSGNTRSSRAGVAEALAQRAYDDRRADVAAGVGRDLTNQFLRSEQTDFNNMMRANQGLRDVFGAGTALSQGGGNALTSAGGMLQTDQQAQLDAEREAFQRQRDFAMQQYGGFGSLLGGVPNVGQVKASTANPYTAALSGAMMGAGFGGNIMDYFSQNRRPSYSNTGFMGPQGYQSYNPTPQVAVSSYY